MVEHVLHHRLGRDPSFGMRTAGELVPGRAHAVSGSEQAGHRGHPVVAPVVVIRDPREVLGAGDPDAGTAGMRAQQVRLGRHDFGLFLVRLDVLARPDAALRDGHVEEVLPSLRLEMLDLLRRHVRRQLRHRGRGVNEDRTAALPQFLHHHVVAQAGSHFRAVGVGVVSVNLQFLEILVLVVFTERIHGLGLE